MSLFKKAERKRVKLKIAITGPSGSGKTFSALELASGLGKKIALIDTENDSASLYSDRFEFDSLVIEPPYTINKYIEAIKAAQSEGYEVLVIDSISHAWAGDGGLLAKKEALDARSGSNHFANWGSISKEQEAFKGMLLNADIHLICTMRSKQEYAQVEDNGKKKVQKLGLAPIQRDGMEYEFTTVFDVAMDHSAAASKDRTGLFDGEIQKITKVTGERFVNWLAGGIEAPKVEEPKFEEPQQKSQLDPSNTSRPFPNGGSNLISQKQVGFLNVQASKVGMPDEVLKEIVNRHGYQSRKLIEKSKFDAILKEVQAYEAPAMAEENIPF